MSTPKCFNSPLGADKRTLKFRSLRAINDYWESKAWVGKKKEREREKINQICLKLKKMIMDVKNKHR